MILFFLRRLPNTLVDESCYRALCVGNFKNFQNEITEKFIRGSGPGGHSINKSMNCVQLIHVPTGLKVECQESR